MTYTFKQQFVSSAKYKYKCPYNLNADGIVIHNTANDASAANEVKYMINNNNYVSYHVAIDDKEVIQTIPFNKNAFHTGDGTAISSGNRTKIGIEICYSKSGGARYTQAEENTVQYVAKLLHERGWDISRVTTHKHWTEVGVKKGYSKYVKNCPHRILDEGRWNSFLKRIEKALAELNKPEVKGVSTDKSTPKVEVKPKTTIEKEVSELRFSSPTLKEKLEMRVLSPATKELLVEKAVAELGYKEEWKAKHKNSQILEGDYIAMAYELAVYYAKYHVCE